MMITVAGTQKISTIAAVTVLVIGCFCLAHLLLSGQLLWVQVHGSLCTIFVSKSSEDSFFFFPPLCYVSGSNTGRECACVTCVGRLISLPVLGLPSSYV